MATQTPAEREKALTRGVLSHRSNMALIARALFRDRQYIPVAVPDVGHVKLTNYNAEMPSLMTLAQLPTDLPMHGAIVDLVDPRRVDTSQKNYKEHVELRTRQQLRAVLEAWAAQRTELETRIHLAMRPIWKKVDQVAGDLPVTGADDVVLTGDAALTERERLSGELSRLKLADVNVLLESQSVPSGFSSDPLLANRQALESLLTVAQTKADWVIGGSGERLGISEAANSDQSTALQTIEVERQKGVRAIQRASTSAAIETAYAAAKVAIQNVTVANTPIWKLDDGAALTLTDGRYVVSYTAAVGSQTFRADNPIIDAEDAGSMGDVAIDKLDLPGPLRFNYQAASGTIGTSFAVQVGYGGDRHPRAGNYDIAVTARNACGPSDLKIRFVVPDLQPSFPRASLPDITMRANRVYPVRKVVQFDEAVGGNGDLTYSISPVMSGPFFPHPLSREISIDAVAPHAPTVITLTATDADGDTATQTVRIHLT